MQAEVKPRFYRFVDKYILEGQQALLFIALAIVIQYLATRAEFSTPYSAFNVSASRVWLIFCAAVIIGYPLGLLSAKLIFAYASERENCPTWGQLFRFNILTTLPLSIASIVQLLFTADGGVGQMLLKLIFALASWGLYGYVLLYGGAYIGKTKKNRILVGMSLVSLCAFVLVAIVAIVLLFSGVFSGLFSGLMPSIEWVE